MDISELKSFNQNDFKQKIKNSIPYNNCGIIFKNRIQWFNENGKIISACSSKGLFPCTISNDVGVNING